MTTNNERKTYRLRATITFEYDAFVPDYEESGLFENEPTPEQCAALDEGDLKDGNLTIYDLTDDLEFKVEPVVA